MSTNYLENIYEWKCQRTYLVKKQKYGIYYPHGIIK